VQILSNQIHIEQELILETGSNDAVSSGSESELVEDNVAADDNNNVTGSRDNIWSRPQHPWNSGGVHPFSLD
jgi:hypothetical protein